MEAGHLKTVVQSSHLKTALSTHATVLNCVSSELTKQGKASPTQNITCTSADFGTSSPPRCSSRELCVPTQYGQSQVRYTNSCCSLRNKLTYVLDHVSEHKSNNVVITESWLSSDDVNNRVVFKECLDYGYKLFHTLFLIEKEGCCTIDQRWHTFHPARPSSPEKFLVHGTFDNNCFNSCACWW